MQQASKQLKHASVFDLLSWVSRKTGVIRFSGRQSAGI